LDIRQTYRMLYFTYNFATMIHLHDH
jgi:hypothetical protein